MRTTLRARVIGNMGGKKLTGSLVLEIPRIQILSLSNFKENFWRLPEKNKLSKSESVTIFKP